VLSTDKTMNHRSSFWVLIGIWATGWLVLAGAGLYLSASTLPCWWDFTRHLGWRPSAACATQLPAIGWHAWIPAALLILLTVTGISRGIFCFASQTRATRRLRRAVIARAVPVPTAVSAIAARAGLSSPILVTDETPFAFCDGLVRSRVVVSTAMVDALDEESLFAVFCHEASHAAAHDPARILTARIARASLFLLPTLRDLEHRSLLWCELNADRTASERAGKLPLGEALRRLLDHSNGRQVPVACLLALAPAERVDALIHGHTPKMRWTPKYVAATATVLLTLVAVGWAWATPLIHAHGQTHDRATTLVVTQPSATSPSPGESTP